MSKFYIDPESALKRANDFFELGKEKEAVEHLYGILKNRKNRISKNVHEAVISKLLEVCVDLKLTVTLKDGLYLYRTLRFGTDIKSWEDAVRRLIDLAEQKIEMNVEDLDKGNSKDVLSYLDQIVTPETVMKRLSDVTDDKYDKRLSIFTWLKFTWECYLICLDLLRNTQVEKIYHLVAQKAMHFCLKYQRKTEFHKLCHVLRIHFGYLFKQNSKFLTMLNSQEVYMLYLETETLGLEIAFELQLWQEVYKLIENLHFLMGFVKRLGNSRIIASYYNKLSQVFLKTGDLTYHAAALFRYFILNKELKKSLNTSEIMTLSSAVVLATLAIPYPPNDPKIELIADNDLYLKEKKHRLMSEVLNFQGKLCRKTLVKELQTYGVVKLAPTQVQELFNILESEFNPLNMRNKIMDITKMFSDSSISNENTLNLYLKDILDVSTTLLLSQLSEIYEKMSWKRFMSLVPISDEFYVERLVVESARRYDIPVILDHRNNGLRFDKVECIQSTIDKDDKECYFLKDKKLSYLSQVYSSLKEVGKYLDFESFKEQKESVRATVYDQCLKVLYENRNDILKRKKIIEKHKETAEKMRVKKEEEERKLIEAKRLEFEQAEKERLLKEAEQRAQKKRILQKEEIRKKILREKIEILKKSELKEAVEKLSVDELDDLDPEIIFSKHFEQILREKKSFASRLRKQERTTNHMERAKRIEEVPVLVQKYEEEKSINKIWWEKNEKLRIEIALEKRANNVREKERFLVMKNDLNDFIAKIKERHKLEYLEEYNAFQKTQGQEREKRLKERAEKRKMQRRLEWLKEQEEARKAKSIKREQKYIQVLKPLREDSQTKGNYTTGSLVEEKYRVSEKHIKSAEYKSQTRNFPKTEDYMRPKYQNKNLIREKPSKWGFEKSEVNEREFKSQVSTKTSKARLYPFPKGDTSNEDYIDYESGSFREKKVKIMSTHQEYDAESSSMLDLGYSPKKETFLPINIEETKHLSACNKQKNFGKKNSNNDYVGRKVFNPQPCIRSSNIDFKHRNEPITDHSKNPNDKNSASMNETGKYEVRHSCTPWAKLKREK